MLPKLGEIKPIRSFIRRERKCLRNAHSKKLWSLWGIQNKDCFFDAEKNFIQTGPITVEIGFGIGEQLITQARQHPEHRFIGIEVYRRGISTLLSEIEKYNLTNIRVFEGDAVEILTKCIPNDSINFIEILFPDPWPKRRHHKRRLIQNSFTTLLTRKLHPSGQLYVSTDWQDYAKHILNVLENTAGLANQNGTNQFSASQDSAILTKFKRRGLALGHLIYDISFRKCF